MKIGKLFLERGKDHEGKPMICLTNDGEGMCFSEKEFEELLKELLYKHF